MSQDASRQERNPLRHRCYMTSGRFGFISYFDVSDLIVIGGTFYLSTIISGKLFVSPAPKLFLTLVMVAVAWVVNFAVKRRLMPSPGIVEHAVNWWFSGVNQYEPDVDEKPVPLLITREMQVGHAVVKAANTVRTPKPKQAVRRRRVRTQEKAGTQ